MVQCQLPKSAQTSSSAEGAEAKNQMKKKSEKGKVQKKKGFRRWSLNKDKNQKDPKHSTLSQRKGNENEAKEAPKWSTWEK